MLAVMEENRAHLSSHYYEGVVYTLDDWRFKKYRLSKNSLQVVSVTNRYLFEDEPYSMRTPKFSAIDTEVSSIDDHNASIYKTFCE